jgi:hypothetical protein
MASPTFDGSGTSRSFCPFGSAKTSAALDRVIALTERACPNALDGLRDALTAYRTYLGLA